MKKKGEEKKPISFKEAIKLAGKTKHLTHKQLDAIRKEQKKKQNSGE